MTYTNRWIRWGAATTAFLGALACLVVTDDVARVSGYDRLAATTAAMVDDNLARDMKTFLSVSAVKAGMAMLEGSTVDVGVGVGVQFEAGDAVQPIYDYIDFVWKMLLYALMVLGFYKVLLETGLLALGIKAFGAGLALWGVGQTLPRRGRNIRRWGRGLLLLGLLTTYAVPAALLGTQYLSDRYVERLKSKYYAHILEFQVEFEQFRGKTVALKDKVSVLRPGKSLDEIQTSFAALTDSLAASSRASVMAFLYYVLLLVFELLFLPLLSAFLLYKLAKAGVDALLGGALAARAPTDDAAPVST